MGPVYENDSKTDEAFPSFYKHEATEYPGEKLKVQSGFSQVKCPLSPPPSPQAGAYPCLAILLESSGTHFSWVETVTVSERSYYNNTTEWLKLGFEPDLAKRSG